MIHLDRVTFGYSKKKKLFENLSLNLEAGHIYGLLGTNGAGKSSLLRNMVGLLYPQAGNINVAGHEPKKRLPAFLQDVYFLPEEIYLPSVTMKKYLEMIAPFYPKFDEAQFDGYIVNMDLPEGNKLTDMSYGQRKKFLIAFALSTNTKILIMDEPTNGLDIPSKSQFRKLVSTNLDRNRLILISTHQVRDLDNLIDSIIILESSKILIQHSLDTVAEKLCFGTLPSIEYDDRVIYSEPSMKGYKAVFENSDLEESRVDLEYLFNAVLGNPERIRQIFTKK
ncbi:ABC transporter ATP-binding protein [Dyadobacter fanqingshengii]|uniref:ABC transporter ATP-binding protein n=1 Tax=Dyadobacter fanqingshengii TaxID=2906443 RepID=A0A9X1T978_9BACT|nr:ABC transporter ATP-binding protein [Dyadobacter fanqingshengii]MCF0039649.1 ABC transporter ATP-binding protein [Dyadobacter fanqingshengii]USJ38585.1 ABC transporter ATP-binding protein [Dyadobacter fanqingshengii]